MRLYTLLSRLPYSVLISSLALVATAVPVDAQDVELRVLTPDDFDATIANGVWFIEHFSPYCGHCRHFAPTWAKLVAEVESRENPGIHLAQVNCAVHGDLCNKNKVDAYPQMNLYRNGEYVDTFTKPRELDLLLEYVLAHAEPTTKPAPPPAITSVPEPQEEVVSIPPAKVYNPSGKLISLDEKSFADIIKEGHVFVKFFAPWCGHCKKLAPTWELLASEMRGKANIAEVDCEDHAAICRSQGVTGYPMLFYYSGGGNGKTEYTGGRKLEQLKAFVEKVSSPAVQELKYEDLVATVAEHPVVYLVIHPASDTQSVNKVTDASQILFGSPPVYSSSARAFFDHFNIQATQAIVLTFKDHDYSAPAAVYPLPQYSQPQTQEELKNWLLRNRLPTATELDADTFQEIMYAEHKPLVVIVAAPPSEYTQTVEKVKDLAKSWKDSKSRGDVVFTWMDADRWGKWLKSMYGIKADVAPQVVVANHSRLIYYEVDQRGEKIKLTTTSLFSVINGAYAGTIPYRHSENVVERFARYMNQKLNIIEHVVSNHPWRVTLVVLATLGCLIVYLRRIIYRESALADEMNRKARLD